MGTSHGMNMRLLGRGYDLSPFVKNVSVKGDRATGDDTTLGDTAREYKGLLQNGSLSASGLYSDAALEFQRLAEAALAGGADASGVYMALPDGHQTVGADFLGVKGIANKYGVKSPVKDLVDTSLEVMSNTGLDIGRVLLPLTAQSGAPPINGTAVDLGQAGTNGGAGLIVVTGFSGANVVYKIQDSTDGATGWADILTFSTVTAIGAERVEIAAGTAVKRYVRCIISSGTVTSMVACVGFSQYPA